MRLEKLYLHDFRNYSRAEVTLAPGVNVFVGQNAQGKTNLLEAIALLSTGRSHRGARDAEMIRWGASGFLVKAQVRRTYGSFQLEFSYQAGENVRGTGAQKAAYLNGGLVRRLSEAIGNLTTVLFSPADLDLIQGSPAARRRYLDIQLSQAGGGYLQVLARYNRALLQRNAMLRQVREEGPGAPRAGRPGIKVPGTNSATAGRWEAWGNELLVPWDAELVAAGALLTAYRSQAVSQLAPLAAAAHNAISGGVDRLDVTYVPGSFSAECDQAIGPDWSAAAGGVRGIKLEEAKESFARALTRSQRTDIARGQTTIGPHRDDLLLKINGVDARTFGSQGQQRTAALALKLAELEFIRLKTGEYPVLLLDDVFSELDSERRKLLLELLAGDVQKVITATGTEGVSWDSLPGAALFEVRTGIVSCRESGDLEG